VNAVEHTMVGLGPASAPRVAWVCVVEPGQRWVDPDRRELVVLRVDPALVDALVVFAGPHPTKLASDMCGPRWTRLPDEELTWAPTSGTVYELEPEPEVTAVWSRGGGR